MVVVVLGRLNGWALAGRCLKALDSAAVDPHCNWP